MTDEEQARKARARAHVEQYRRTNGAEAGSRGGHRVLLLTTQGRKTGRPATVPLNYFPAGDGFLIVASNYGEERAPDWYLNLTANPQVRIQISADEFTAAARTATPEERPSLWAELIQAAPFYGAYQANMARTIPLVILQRDERS